MFLKIIGNSLLGILLIYIWSQFVDLSHILEILKDTNFIYLISFVIFFVLSTVLRGIRFKLLLDNKEIPLKDLVMINFLSQFLSFMIPIRAGEVTKSVYLSTQFHLPFGKSLIWVLIDRFLDFWGVIFSIGILMIFIDINLPSGVKFTIYLILLGFSLGFYFLIKADKFCKKLTDFLSNFIPVKKVKIWFKSFSYTIIDSFDILRANSLKTLGLIGLTLITFVSDGMIWYFVFLSIGVKFGIIEGILGNLFLALTFILPAAPGFVGSAEAAGLAVWSGLMGLDSNLASAATVLFHILTIVFLMIFGVGSLYLLDFDLNLVWKKIRNK